MAFLIRRSVALPTGFDLSIYRHQSYRKDLIILHNFMMPKITAYQHKGWFVCLKNRLKNLRWRQIEKINTFSFDLTTSFKVLKNNPWWMESEQKPFKLHFYCF